MSAPWECLFTDAAVNVAVDLFINAEPDAFVTYADRIITLSAQYESDHREERPDVPYVVFEEPAKLRQCLRELKRVRVHPEWSRFTPKPVQASTFARLEILLATDPIRQQGAMLLIERFEAFQAEPGPIYINKMQLPAERQAHQQRKDAAQGERIRDLPPADELRREYQREAADPTCRRQAANKLAAKYQVSPQAVRQKLNPKNK